MVTTQKITEKKNLIASLDGVRAIACLSVVSYHVHYLIGQTHSLGAFTGSVGYAFVMSGWSGVSLFFVLSGFLLFMPYAKALLLETPLPLARTFYQRRVFRIIPGYYVSLGILILLAHPEYLQWDHIQRLGLFLTFLMDAPATYQQINGPFWTLAVEWQYYMLLPLLVLVVSWIAGIGKSPRQRFCLVSLCLFGLMLWGVSTRYIGHYYTLHPTATFVVPRPVLDKMLLVIYGSDGKFLEDFAVGMFVCSIYTFVSIVSDRGMLHCFIKRYSLWLWRLGILFLFFIAIWTAFYSRFAFLNQFLGSHGWLVELSLAVGYGLCIVAILVGPAELRTLFEWKPLRWIGSISYSMYIWHVPLLLAFKVYLLPHLAHRFLPSYALYWSFVAIIVVPFSYLFYRLVEQPWIQLAQKKRQQEVIPQIRCEPLVEPSLDARQGSEVMP